MTKENMATKLVGMMNEGNDTFQWRYFTRNGVERIGILFDDNAPTSPIVYLNDFDEMLEAERYEDAAEIIVKSLKEHRGTQFNTYDLLFNLEYLEKNLILAVAHESNLDGIFSMPVRDTDLRKYLKLRVSVNDSNGCITLTSPIIEKIQEETFVSLDSLIKWATANTTESMDFFNISEVLPFPMDDPIGMYVLSNKNRYYGAGLFAIDSVLNAVCEELNTNRIVILPSSIHEVIILKEDGSFDNDAMIQTVREINSAEVRPEEKLSDNVYYYELHY